MASAVTNTGTIEATGGTLRLGAAKVVNDAGGTLATGSVSHSLPAQGGSNAGVVALTSGTLNTGSGRLSNSGKVELAAGSGVVYGNLVGDTGSLAVVLGNSLARFNGPGRHRLGHRITGFVGSVATFFGATAQRTRSVFSGTGLKFYEGSLSVGATPGFGSDVGDFCFGAGNMYLVDVGSATPCNTDCSSNESLKHSSFDNYVVAGHLNLGGTLKLSSWNGSMAQVGLSFGRLDWGSVSGSFSAMDTSNYAVAARGLVDTSRLIIDGTVSIVAGPESDECALFVVGLVPTCAVVRIE